MFRKRFIFLFLILLIAANNAQAKEDVSEYDLGQVVVTAGKTEQYVSEIGAAATVITSEDIKASAKSTVFEVLRDIPGVSLSKNGGLGGRTSIYLRGTKPGHTLILVDGVEINDPISTDRSADVAHILVDNIERIEIIRGPQNTLYGSDAMGGVINIITKKGKGANKINYSLEAGSHNTFTESLGVSGQTERFNYSASIFRKDSDGISMAKDVSEKDAYENTTFSSCIGIDVSDNSRMSFVMRYTDADYDIDDGAYEDDPNYTSKWKQFSSKVRFEQDINDSWDHVLSCSFMDIERSNRDLSDSVDITDDLDDKYLADNKKIEWQHNVSVLENLYQTAGFEYEQERATSDYRQGSYTDRIDRRSVANRAFYFQNQIKISDDLSTLIGMRVDNHDIFNRYETYKVSSVYSIDETNTLLKANWATGFKAPSIYQLYSSYGNSDLSPDKSRGYDLGFERKAFNDNLNFTARYFYNNFKNMVEFDMSDWKYKNIGRAKTSGYEIESTLKLFEDITLGANYTYLRAKNKDTGKRLARRPKHSANLSVDWAFIPKWNANITANYVGSRFNDTSNNNKLKDFITMDLSVGYDIKDNLECFARIVNLFDRDYQFVRGYNTEARSFYAGVRGSF